MLLERVRESPAGEARPAEDPGDGELAALYDRYFVLEAAWLATEDTAAREDLYAAMDAVGVRLYAVPAGTVRGLAIKLRFLFREEARDIATTTPARLADMFSDSYPLPEIAAVLRDADRLAT
ncbi:MAG: hypothetical protein GVY13_08940 [Alphaproteobacteria bacterium]|jgi:hypothetical protein|nr:hypothetical protein [Alphaproteobacteria bacterium]